MDWTVSSPNSYVKPQPSIWLYLETEPLRRRLRLNGIVRVGPWSNWIGVFIRRGRNTKDPSLPTNTEKRPCQDTAGGNHLPARRKVLNARQGPYWHLELSLQNHEKTNFRGLSSPVCSTLHGSLSRLIHLREEGEGERRDGRDREKGEIRYFHNSTITHITEIIQHIQSYSAYAKIFLNLFIASNTNLIFMFLLTSVLCEPKLPKDVLFFIHFLMNLIFQDSSLTALL